MARNSVAQGFFWPFKEGSAKAFGPSASLCCTWGFSPSSFLRWPQAGFDWHKGKRMAFLLLGLLSLHSSAVKSWLLDSVPVTAPSVLPAAGWRGFTKGTASLQVRHPGSSRTQGQCVKYCILDTSHPALQYCRDNLHCPFVLFTPLPLPSKKEGGKEKGKGKKKNKPKMQNQNVRRKRKWHYLAKLQGELDQGVWCCWQKRGPKLQGLRVGFRLKREEDDNGTEPGKWRSRVKGWALRVGGRSLSQAGLWVWDWGQPAHGCACPAWAAAATALVTVLTSAMGYYVGGKKCVELYFALIIISISITLLCGHLFTAWVKLYFFVSVLLLLFQPRAQRFHGQFRSFGEIYTLPGWKVPPTSGLNCLSCSEKYFAEQPWQGRFVQGCFHLPVPLHACLAVVLQQLGDG